MLVLSPTPAAAQLTASGHVALKGTYIEVGVNKAGYFGLPTAEIPAGYHAHSPNGLGFVADYRKNGWTAQYGGDYFTPGSPYEGFIVTWVAGGSTRSYENAGARGQTIPTVSLVDSSSGTTKSAVWVGEVANGTEKLKVVQTYSFKTGDLFFTANVQLINTGTTTLTAVKFGRNVDPDNDQTWPGGSYTTTNVVAYQPGVAGNVTKALVTATAIGVTDMVLGLGAIDSRAMVTAQGGPDPGNVILYPVAGPVTSDVNVALAFGLGDLAPGQSVTFDYAYILSASDLNVALGSLAAVTVLQPTGTVSGTVVPFQATTDNLAQTTNMDFYINGTLVASDSVPSAGVFETTFNSTTYANGTLNLKVVATVNGLPVEKSTTVVVDNTGPPMVFAAPLSGQTVNGDGLSVQVNGTDALNPPTQVTFYREVSGQAAVNLGTDSSAPFTATFNTSDLAGGTNITIRAVGRNAAAQTTNITVSVIKANNYTVNFATDGTAGSTLTGTASQSVAPGANCTAVTANTPTGYHFVNWTGTGGFVTTTTNPLTITNVTGNMNVTANYAINTYAVTFQTDGTLGTTLTGSASQTVNHGTSATAVTANAPVSHHFVNWTGTGGFVTTTSNPLTVSNVTSAMVITANYAINSYAVTFATDGTAGSTLTGTASQTIVHGNNGTAVTANAPANWHFVNWTGTGGFVTTTSNPVTVSNVSAAMALTAHFAIDTHTVTFQTDGTAGTAITGTLSQTINHGSNATAVTATFPANYHLVNWTGTGGFVDSTSNPLTVSNVTAAMVITAHFALNDIPPTLVVTPGTTTYTENAGNTPVAVDATLGLTDPDGPNLSGARISISSGYVSTEDRLAFTLQGGVTGSFDIPTGVITLTGSASAATYQSILRSVTYYNVASGVPTAGARVISFSLGANSLLNPANGHFYEFVTSPAISWTDARTAAAARSYYGMQGYLVTVTSAAENTFVTGKLAGQGWMGASDEASEWTWRWVTGPEGLENAGAGRHFFTEVATCVTGARGTAVGGYYNNWASCEPNDAGGEDYAHFLAGGEWNDYPLSLWNIEGYVVEYGGMPTDPVLTLSGSRNLTVVALPRFTVTASAGAGGSITPVGAQQVRQGDAITFTMLPGLNMRVADVVVDSASVGTPLNYTFTNVTAAHSIAATFGPASYSVTFATDGTAGSSLTGTTTQTVAHGADSTAVTAVVPTGYHFVNWTGTGGYTSVFNPVTVANVTGTMALVAHFAINQYTVTFQTDGLAGSSLTGTTSQTLNHGANATAVTANAPVGHHFVNWTGTGGFSSSANPLTVNNVTGNLTIMANFAITQYAVTFATDGTSGASLSGTAFQLVNHGSDAAAVTAVAPTGWHFVSWTGSATTTANPLQPTNVTGPLAFTANFAINQYTVTFATDGTPGANLSGTTSQVISHGADATAVSASVPATYYFVDWTDGAGFTSTANPLTVTNVTRSMNLVVAYAPKDVSSVAVSSSANPSFIGAGVHFTATLTPSESTGTVQFKVGGTNLGTPVTLVGGVAQSISTSSLTVGNHVVTAEYTGDTTRLPATGTLTGGQVVNRYGSSVDVASAPNPSQFGESVAITATVTSPGGGVPGGTATFMAGTMLLGDVTLNGSGVAVYNTTALDLGTTDLWVSYSGDATHNTALSLNVPHVVEAAQSTLVVGSTPNPSLFGAQVTVSVDADAVAPGAGVLTGTVDLLDGTTVIASTTLVAGHATFTTTALAVGTHSLTVAYAGDGFFLPSNSSAISQEVQPACVIGSTVYAHLVLNPLNSCEVCDSGANVYAWTNVAAAAACASDGLDCTQDVCNGTGTCLHNITTGCVIGGACVATSTTDPGNDCKLCEPTTSTSVYSPKALRTACLDDGSPITNDYCDGRGLCVHPPRNVCSIGGVTFPGGSINPENSCQVCDVLANQNGWSSRATGSSCATDNLGCTLDTCDGAGTCNHDLIEGCLIGGACVATHGVNPANDCMECNPAQDTHTYTNSARGVDCADDGLANTLDVCDGVAACTHPLRGHCVIAGVTFRAGDANPDNGCQSCDPASSVSVWTNRVGGFPCAADALGCTTDECDGAGACTHDLYTGCLIDNACVPSGATDPTNECLGCFPAVSSSSYTPKATGVACTDDGLNNTADVCNGGDACVHPLLGECIIGGITYRAGVANPLNGCQACQPAQNVGAWTDRVSGFPCAGDGLDCTSDVCDGAGSCGHHLFTGCLIEGACVASGGTDPSNECQGCFPATSTAGYTPKAQGVDCSDDGQQNTADICNGTSACVHPLLGECVIDSTTYRSGTPNPANPCQSCQPQLRINAWSDRVSGFPCTADALDCTADVCDGAGACTHPLYTGCLMGGACVIPGTNDPTNDCLACDPVQSTTVYSPKLRGVACADDQLPNTLDACNGAGTCTHDIAGQCNIGGATLNAGMVNPANSCQYCDPTASVGAWTDRVSGFPCTSDGLDCTMDVCNAVAVCEHQVSTSCLVNGACVAAGTTDPANDCNACNPAASTTTYTPKLPGVACADDGQPNTLDTCDGQGACAHVAGGQCTIGGVLYGATAANPANPCQWCDPASSISGWTDRVDGFPCTSDGLDCTSDVCGVGGVCEHRLFTGCLVDGSCVTAGGSNPANECTACIPAASTMSYSGKAHGVACTDEGDATTLDQCDGAGVCLHLPGGECLIDGVTVAAGAANPANPCQACDASQAAFAWSNRADNFPCGADGLDCTSDVCNGAGTCEHRLFTGCLVAGACVAAGAADPQAECRACAPDTATDGYSVKAAGVACTDDGVANTVDACDGTGACLHTLAEVCVIGGSNVNAGAANPANPCQWCNPATSVSQWSNRAAGYTCASDGLICTSDVCDATGQCGHAVAMGCVINNSCVAAAATNPADACFACLPDTSRSSYTRVAQSDACGATCAADAECGDGFCLNAVCRQLQAEGAVCTASSQCSSGTCEGGLCVAGTTPSGGGCGCNVAETDRTSALVAALMLGWLFRRHAGRRTVK